MTIEFIPDNNRKFGKFTVLPEDVKRVRKEAEARGEDPDAAEKTFRDEIDRANARLQS